MVNEVMDFIEKYDPEVGAAIKDEAARQRRNLELIASENIVSEPVMMAMGTVLTNKYAEGYSGKRYYGGCEYIDVVETIASCLAVIMPMYSHIPAHRPIWRYLWRCWRQEIPLWA